MVFGFLSIVFVLWSATFAVPQQTAAPATRTVQIVYESDTRGYYLPCG